MRLLLLSGIATLAGCGTASTAAPQQRLSANERIPEVAVAPPPESSPESPPRWSNEIAAEVEAACPGTQVGGFAVRPYGGEVTALSSRATLLADEDIVNGQFAVDERAYLVDLYDPERDDYPDDYMNLWALASERAGERVVTDPFVAETMPLGPELGFHWETLEVLEDGTLVNLVGFNSPVETDEEGLRGSGPWEMERFRIALASNIAVAWTSPDSPDLSSVDLSIRDEGDVIVVRACGERVAFADAAPAISSSMLR